MFSTTSAVWPVLGRVAVAPWCKFLAPTGHESGKLGSHRVANLCLFGRTMVALSHGDFAVSWRLRTGAVAVAVLAIWVCSLLAAAGGGLGPTE